jgi:hypothetical protein
MSNTLATNLTVISCKHKAATTPLHNGKYTALATRQQHISNILATHLHNGNNGSDFRALCDLETWATHQQHISNTLARGNVSKTLATY